MANILLVMNDLLLLDTTALTLEVVGGHNVVKASCAEIGTAYLKTHLQFDLVIVSCSNGDALERLVADQHRSLHVMVCDGRAQNSNGSKQKHIVKSPLTAYDLLEPVQEIFTNAQ